MSRLTLFFSVIFILFACDNDLDEVLEESNCLEELIPIDNSISNCFTNDLDTTRYCEQISLEQVFKLSNEAMTWLSYYCNPIEDKFYFVDENNQETFFELTDKEFEIRRQVFNGFDNCEDGTDRYRLYCANEENLKTKLFSELLNIEIEIQLTTAFERPFEDLKHGIELYIRDENKILFHTIIEEGSLDPLISSNHLHFEEIEILDETYFDVFSYKSVIDTSNIQFFYNKDLGIVSFIDQFNNQWKRK